MGLLTVPAASSTMLLLVRCSDLIMTSEIDFCFDRTPLPLLRLHLVYSLWITMIVLGPTACDAAALVRRSPPWVTTACCCPNANSINKQRCPCFVEGSVTARRSIQTCTDIGPNFLRRYLPSRLQFHAAEEKTASVGSCRLVSGAADGSTGSTAAESYTRGGSGMCQFRTLSSVVGRFQQALCRRERFHVRTKDMQISTISCFSGWFAWEIRTKADVKIAVASATGVGRSAHGCGVHAVGGLSKQHVRANARVQRACRERHQAG